MSPWNVIVLSGGIPPVAESVRERVLSGWSDASGLEMNIVPSATLDAESVNQADLLVTILDEHVDVEHLESAFELAENRHVPIVALVSDHADVSALHGFEAFVEPLDGPLDALLALLRTLLMRQRQVARLRTELTLASRFTGGLRGEIARMHDELQLAAMIQKEMLPREMPDLHGMRFDAMWRPASYVSGDIYDVVRLDEDHVGVFLADAVGHGVPAALLTMVIRQALRTKNVGRNSYEILAPSETMKHLNDEMVRRQAQTTRFATAVYGVLDCRRRVLTLAGAGHPPPLHLRSDGTVHRIETTGGLLGVFPDETFGQVEIELGVGDTLLLYSDGFEQAFPEVDRDDYERRLPTDQYLEEFARLGEHADPALMVEAIRARVDTQAGSLHQPDDLTLICVAAGPLGAGSPDVGAALLPTSRDGT